MQRGTIIKHNGSWTLLYRDTVIRGGVSKRLKVSKKLAKISPEYPTKTSVRHLADEILSPLNRKQVQPESSLTVAEYIEDRYFPSVKQTLRPATVDSYKWLFSKVKDKLDIRVRDFRTVHGQRLLREITAGRRTVIHVKAFLSSVFKHCKQEGILDGQNPMADTSVPGRPAKFRGRAYTLGDFARMLEDLEVDVETFTDEENSRRVTASEVISIMALTGLRTSECRGLRWSDWDESRMLLNVQRSAWETTVGPTKNTASEGSIPLIPLVTAVLQARRERVKGKPEDYIFAGERRGTPLNFQNLRNRVIQPALEASMLFKKNGEGEKDWVRDRSTGIDWKGYHGFRRGLASNLFSLGVNPKIVAAILRHSDVGTTLAWYIQTPEAESRNAMEKLEAKFSTLLSEGRLSHNGI